MKNIENNKCIGIEIPGVNSLKELEETLKLAKDFNIQVSQVNEVIGASLIPKSELKEMLCLAREAKIGLTLSPTVRPEYEPDTAFYRTPWGREQGRRINHPDKLKRAYDEVLRFIEMGCRGFILYDLGLVRLLNEGRQNNVIPSTVILKASTHCGITNHMTALVYAENGIDDIIPAHDLSIDTLISIRKALPDTMLSIVTDTYATKGGFIRIFDVPEFIKYLPPLFLKMGNSVHDDPYLISLEHLPTKIRRVRSVLDSVEKEMMDIKHIGDNSLLMAIPCI